MISTAWSGFHGCASVLPAHATAAIAGAITHAAIRPRYPTSRIVLMSFLLLFVIG
jgi:hypothetical protein